MFQCELLRNELTDLERNINTGKVDHTESGSKDLADAVCGALYNASKNAEEFAYDYGENIDSIVNVSGNYEDNIKQQITVDFEEALKQIKDPLKNISTSDKERLPFLSFGKGNKEPNYSDMLAISEGMLLI